ncbi:MAG TPA: amino acid adenylation domain-containing protein, partial [Pyrinomonadaceae bacterium]
VSELRIFQKSNFPLTVIVGASQALTLELVYDESRFSAAFMIRLLKHFQQLLLELVVNPQTRIAELPWLTEAERHQVLVEWNDTESVYPSAVPLSLLCAQQLSHAPDAIALQSDDLQISCLCLHQRANQLAHLFRVKGVAPGQVIGLCLPRSPALVISILATIKVGATYLPLDPSYPPQRLSFMLADSDAALLLTNSELVAAATHRALSHSVQIVVDLSRDQHSIDSQPAADLVLPEPLAAGAGQSAYINYTSGSTGKPKGILIPHQAVSRLVCNTNLVQLSSRDHIAQVSNASFDALTFELWGALLNGARLNLVLPQTVLSPVDYGKQIVAQQLNVMFLTTALFNQMAREAPWALDSVTDLLVGGQAVEPKWAKALLDRGYEGRLLNGYGPTEGTTFSCTTRIEGITDDTTTVPIGRALSNTELYVLDQEQRLVPVDVTGELYIGGDGLALGYINNIEMTAEKFVPHPYSRRPGARLYRSGDRARYRGNGLIECLGRVDAQVKIRGYRIEPEEVASVLRQDKRVSEAVVVIGADYIGEKQLVAYVVEREGAQINYHDLKNHLRESLPEYMMPAVMIKLDRIPLNPNGKIDFSALPKTGGDAGESMAVSLTPLTPIQQALSEIWTDVLKLESCRITDSFFDLGGHSLLATQVLSRLNLVFQVSLPLRVLFETPTIAALAQIIEESRREGSFALLPPLEPVSRAQDLPLSFTQQRFWFMDRLVRNSARHNVPAGVGFAGKLNLAALEQVFSEIVRRHEVLRTTIGQAEEDAIQIVHPHRPLSLPIVDLQGLDEHKRGAVARKLLDEQAQRPFDLIRGPVLRLAVIKSGPNKHELLMNSHHIITDAWSTGLFVRELVTLYQSALEGRPSPLCELPVQYADFAVWQRRLPVEFINEQLTYWEKKLSGVPSILEALTDCSRLQKKRTNYGNHAFFLPPGLHETLTTLSRREGVTLFMTLLAAYQTLLYRYSGLEQICVGSPILNRHQADTQNLIGCFINLLALNTDVSGNPSFRELLGRVREVTLGAYDHQDLPFEMVVGKLQMGGNHGVSPLAQVAFSLQNASSEQLKLPHLTVSPLAINAGAVEFDLCLLMHSGAEGAGGMFVYNADLFEKSEIERLASHLSQILEQVVSNPDCSLLDLELSGTGEQRRPKLASGASAQLATEQFTF